LAREKYRETKTNRRALAGLCKDTRIAKAGVQSQFTPLSKALLAAHDIIARFYPDGRGLKERNRSQNGSLNIIMVLST
jgi:hypothetical protein